MYQINKFSNIDHKQTIFAQQANCDILEIFDRSQRTRASTLASKGDFNFLNTYSRIGSFMDYSSRLTFAFSGFVSFFSESVDQNHIPERNPHQPKPPNSQALSTFDSHLSCCFLSAIHNFS